MKRFLMAAIFLVLLSGCAKRTEYGDCVGIADDKDPKLVYKMSARNVLIGVLFFELLVPPVSVLANEFYCPEGRK